MEWIQTDDWQWQRKLGNGEYEMYEVQYIDYLNECRWFAGGGVFSISDYDGGDVEHALKVFGYFTMEKLKDEYGEDSERILAECLFECNFADFDLECFDTEGEAMAYVKKLMKED